MAAEPGHDPEHLTERASSSIESRPAAKRTRSAVEEEVSAACEIDDWRAFVRQIQRVRREVGASATRWAGPCLATALQLAVRGRDWPSDQAADALRRVAADPESRSPMRVAEAGPWWDKPPATQEHPDADGVDLRAMEVGLLEAGGVRIELQMLARRALEDAGIPVTRNAVIRGAYRLLLDRETAAADGTVSPAMSMGPV